MGTKASDKNKLIHVVPSLDYEKRLSDYLVGVFPDLATRNSAKKAIKRGMVKVNGKDAQTGIWVREGMQIEYQPVVHHGARIYKRKIEIAYQDENLAIFWKPSGLLTSGNAHQTLHNLLLYNLDTTGLYPPRPVHRLDRATSGLVIVSRTAQTTVSLTNLLQNREITKTYHAVVTGDVPEKDLINDVIENRQAETEVKLIETSTSGYFSMLQLRPKTGRTHQLRIHCANHGYPIVGDQLYGTHDQRKGLYLSATGLAFIHPVSGEKLVIEKEIPRKLLKMMQK